MARKFDIRRGDGSIEERVRRDGTVVWQARWHDGAGWRTKTFTAVEKAEDHLREIGRKKRRNQYTPDSELTVAEVVAEYIERGQSRWSANTVATYSLLARRYIVPQLGKTQIVALTPRRVQNWIDEIARILSPAVVENARTVLSGACKEAMQLGVLRANPVSGTRTPSRQRAVKATWTAQEVATVLEYLADDVRHHAYYLVALTTAMRPGELRALQWGDIDFDAGVITCQRTMTRDAGYHHMIGATTKTKRTRSIAVPQSACDALRAARRDQLERRLRAGAWADLGIVFDRGDGNPIAQQSMANVHSRIIAATGVRRIRMHDLRHTAATLMLRNNVHPKIVSEILGHGSIATTLDIYSHVDVSMQRLATDALADAFAKAGGEA